MCGIHLSLSKRETLIIPPTLSARLRNRGPDYLGSAQVLIRNTKPSRDDFFLHFTSTVLSLRGDGITPQPFVDPQTGSVFCWNGEAWKIRGLSVGGNDGGILFSLLSLARDHLELLEVLRGIQGPFAFIYLDKRPGGQLYFGRDRLGRRSLLRSTKGPFALSSIADPPYDEWAEVEADGIYSLDLGSMVILPNAEIATSSFTRHCWSRDAPHDDSVSSVGVFNASLPPSASSSLVHSTAVETLRHHLVESLKLRVLDISTAPSSVSANAASAAILFSGGVDCTVLARLAHDIVPQDQHIELINVAFENPRVYATQKTGIDGFDVYEACPDRITGRNSLQELQKHSPGREWRFIAVNIPFSEATAHRASVISLMIPSNTEMDLSIAYAFYFAARGRGICQLEPGAAPQEYTTEARVLISGLGADELFGGYLRHSLAFERMGYSGLLAALKLDAARLGKRNLGRDDRVVAHWGREVRYPFLDESLFQWAVECPVWQKCDFATSHDYAGIEPGKRVLRLLAEEVGLEAVAREKKRAIQFGSRTAKMESGRVKGTDLITLERV